jgi:hypothetical protein
LCYLTKVGFFVELTQSAAERRIERERGRGRERDRERERERENE